MRHRHFGPILAIALAACGGSGGGGGGGGSGGTGGRAEDCEQEPSKGLSEACCPAHGMDACGAGLFCAAFDGRKTPTCYAERSRLDMTTCGEDRQCVSASCNVEAGLCRTLGARAVCDPAIGCAPDLVTGAQYVCLDSKCVPGDGTSGSACGTSADCREGACIDNYCIAGGPTCGGGSGNGPCALDPIGKACFDCREKSWNCRCADENYAWLECAKKAGCTTQIDDTRILVVQACVFSRCGDESCALEQCANQVCGEENCY